MSVFQTSRFRALIIVVLCGVLALASGCSALRLGYGTAPEIVYWWLDGYVDFDHAQSQKMRDAVARWFAWHRRTQLPDYAALLARARSEVLADTTAARVCEWQADIVARARTALDQAVPDTADLVLTVTPQQIRHIQHHYAKKNDDFRDDYVQPDLRKRAEKALDRTIDRAEMLYGHLDDAQRARIAQALTSSPFDPERWLAERQQRQHEALQMLRRLTAEGASPDQAQAALRVYVEHLLRSPREAYRRYAARLDEFNCAFAAELHNSTSAAQRRTAAGKLAGWEGDLRALAASAAPVS